MALLMLRVDGYSQPDTAEQSAKHGLGHPIQPRDRIAANCALDMMRARGHRLQTRIDALDERAQLPETARPGPDRWSRSTVRLRIFD